jgi:hypothetical protein
MAGALTISTLNNDTGVLATQNGMTGIAKAWAFFNGSAATVTAAFNVSSITKTAVGNYVVNFTTAMPTANFAANYNSAEYFAGVTARTTGSVTVQSTYPTNTGGAYSGVDETLCNVVVYSA